MNRLLGILVLSGAFVLGGMFVAAQIDLNTFTPNTAILASEVNENFAALRAEIEALQSGGAGIPAGAVMAFDRSTCPSGWSVFEEARGRFIVGLPDGGTLAGTAGGDPLSDLEVRAHTHSVNLDPVFTTPAGDHTHLWAEMVPGRIWEDGAGTVIIDWTDGMDTAGADFYPIGVSTTTSRQFFTDSSSDHTHQVDVGASDSSADSAELPVLQLLVCEKD